ncbi:uncharacterized protein Nmag_2199 [Natrialba magadii ATCC 43099]|uniref:PGF-CTERM sorting domain-containing protein n=1 Tax=Natrialba magadii (strain ATCC 43099 / DSM 3394 / CCM 3739 / CIP 104546 / IAM 13178 / JCM 8861 / NBRC 102185 / NCIMB 2190 / MS3) TaxID=547559 RepID=D3SWA5_NATMM|nr:Hvo_1808 family surface protein [Natrialba magadii]ADD05766.1 uncharacterized protein Nmag_2199 [Natrialba magadii ATCC 43099]ELY30159.1 hypothetical protein C500_09404 [Natrialba magadii ATCC 43099]
MNPTRTQLTAGLAVLAALVLLGAAIGGVAIFSPGDDPGPGPDSDSGAGDHEQNGLESEVPQEDRPDDPATTETIGYVDGYWYDDELPVDDRDDAVVESDELDAVVARSMARVELIRNLTFEGEADVDVISREEYQAEHGDMFANVTGDEHLQQNVNYEALFMVDRETDATDAFESLYGGAVDGFYDPATDEIVLVSDNPDTPELDEVVLGHELLHALQDQHFDLRSYDRETIDQDNAKNGLIEGDAVWVDTAYEQRCEADWDCLQPDRIPPAPDDLNWGLYLTMYQPYDDGPDYVDYLLEQDSWDAVDAAYDDPPASSSEVIRPGDDREPTAIEVEDQSNDEWTQLELDDDVASESVGEAGMVAMFAGGAFDPQRPTVIDRADFVGSEMGYEFDHAITDGWAGDELVTYVATNDGETADDADVDVGDTGYVWQTEWTSTEDASQFADAYLELLALYDGESVDDSQDTYVIDDGFPGAYHVEQDDETVTIVRAPTVDDLDAIDPGAVPGSAEPAGSNSTDSDATTASTTDDQEGAVLAGLDPGFGTVTAVFVSVALAATGGWLVILRTRARPRIDSLSPVSGSHGARRVAVAGEKPTKL